MQTNKTAPTVYQHKPKTPVRNLLTALGAATIYGVSQAAFAVGDTVDFSAATANGDAAKVAVIAVITLLITVSGIVLAYRVFSKKG